MGHLAEETFALDSLKRAWQRVLINDRADGIMSPSSTRFLENENENLESLNTQLADCSYRPGTLTQVTITTGSKRRELHIPCARDRVVARAILESTTPFIDPVLGPGAFAYRPGLGVNDAVQAVTALRDEGLTWVLRTDIKDCFPSLSKETALNKFVALVDDPLVTNVVAALLQRTYRAQTGGVHRPSGVVQGCPLSPVLANLVLAHLDFRFFSEGLPIIRYADDILVATSSKGEASQAAQLASSITKELGMELNEEKSKIVSFEDGFTFLGEDFGPRYPPCLNDHRVEEPNERTLYVGLQGCRVRIASGRIIVSSKDDSPILDVPSSQVGRIACFGAVGLSAGVRTWAFTNEVDVVFASRKGNYLGTMLRHGRRYRPARVRAQIFAGDSARGLEISRQIVGAKISKQQVLLQRMNRRPNHKSVADAIHQLGSLMAMLPDAASQSELMGLEGAAARFYFSCLGLLVPEPLRFTERSRQPPLDVVNAALSYLYTILMGECVTALHAAGLDPAFGILHSDQANRPSLALDLMEEFRPWLVDQVVIEAAIRKRLTVDHGRTEDGKGVLLTKQGKQIIVDAYERRLLGYVKGSLPDFAGTRRRHLYRQAERLRAAIMSDQVNWTGMSWRP